ncbi:hypothetical protein ACIGJO_24300 [Streptomyces sp. NPDC079020]|uniref:hypothetical protein n=1 Tax=Streptomyces sp. NPDC079020 TaxID=3365722 RepID=UPI0037CD0802
MACIERRSREEDAADRQPFRDCAACEGSTPPHPQSADKRTCSETCELQVSRWDRLIERGRASPAFQDMRVLRHPDRSEVARRSPSPLVQPALSHMVVRGRCPIDLLEAGVPRPLPETDRPPQGRLDPTLVLARVLPVVPWLA